jgi:hypothetical protein
MKNLLFSVFLVCVTQFSFAECGLFELKFFPLKREIGLNSRFIVEAYRFSNEIKFIENFRKSKVFLRSENGDMIQLRLQHIFKGQFNLTQAIFKPMESLMPNCIDELQIEGSAYENFERYNPQAGKYEKVYWKTSSKHNIEVLNNPYMLQFQQTQIQYFGCGPEANAIFEIDTQDTSVEIWYKAELVELATQKKSTYIITSWKGKLYVGHDMCSGAFTFKAKGKYGVRFTPMNTDGVSLPTTTWEYFDTPDENHVDRIKF